MSNLADQPLIPCPSIAKYWQSYITEMTTGWQNQAKSSEMSEMQLLSSVRILLVQPPDSPPSQSTFFNLLSAEVGVDAVKYDDRKKISFQSVALGSNLTFLFTLKSKKMQHDCYAPADADTKFRYTKPKMLHEQEWEYSSPKQLNYFVHMIMTNYETEMRVKERLVFLKSYSIIFLPLLFLHNLKPQITYISLKLHMYLFITFLRRRKYINRWLLRNLDASIPQLQSWCNC